MSTSFLKVALTGGIATGKSKCLRRFAALGVPTLDSDRLARDAVAPGTAGLSAVVARFGHDLLTTDGSLNRAKLADIVFSDPRALRDLEAIVHPFVFAAVAQWFKQLSLEESTSPLAIADVPLLYETGYEQEFDRVIVAACTPEQQLARIIARDGVSEAQAAQRIAAQWPIERKRELADYVIDTSGTIGETERQVDEIASKLGLKQKQA